MKIQQNYTKNKCSIKQTTQKQREILIVTYKRGL